MRTGKEKDFKKITDNFEKKCIEFDLDQTLLYTDKEYNIIGCNQKLIDLVNKLCDKGVIIIIRTGRNWGLVDLTEMQLKQCKIKYNSLIMGKAVCDYYVDDKGLTPEDFLKKFGDI